MLRLLTLSTLFPNETRPEFGIFVERQTLSLAKRDDLDVRVIAPVGMPPWPLSQLGRYRVGASLPHRERWKGLDVYRPRFLNLPGTGGRFHARTLADAVLPLARRLHAERPFDLIAAEFFYPDGPAAARIASALGLPFSITARGSDIHHWGRVPGIAGQMLDAGNRAAGMIAVSEALRDDMAALGLPASRIRPNTTGVDLARFALRDRATAKAELGIDGPLVVSLGALIPLKGHAIVIDAVARLPGVQLRIAGQGPERERLQAHIDRLNLRDRVTLLGGVAQDAVPALLAGADVMALASEREGLANAWVEAIASGTPIVVPDIGGARQVLRGGAAAGRLAERTPAGFAAAIEAILAAPPARSEVRRVVEPYSWQANGERLHGHYARLAAGGGRNQIDSRASLS